MGRVAVLRGLALALGLGVQPAAAFMITTPTSGALLRAGQSVEVRVELGTDTGLSNVRYYWYREEEEPLPGQLARSALVAGAHSSPPYGGALRVPDDAIGRVRLLAVGEVTRGRLGTWEEFDELTVDVEPSAPLLGIEFEVEKPWRLETLGKIVELPVVGQYADGVVRRIGGVSTGTIYRSSNESVLQVLPQGLMRVTGNGKAVVTVRNRDKQATLDVLVKSDDEPNRPPVARAGSDLTVRGGARVVLDGLQSSDPDGDPLRFEWTQISGNKVSLLDQNTNRPSFVAPKVSVKRQLRFRLQVTDMKGPDTVKGADSVPGYVTVWIEP
jgi:hypothetical protein